MNVAGRKVVEQSVLRSSLTAFSSVQNEDARFQQMWSKSGSGRRPLHSSAALGRSHGASTAGAAAAAGAGAAAAPVGASGSAPQTIADGPPISLAPKPLCAKAGGCTRLARATGCTLYNVCCEEADKLRFLGSSQSPHEYSSTCNKHKASTAVKQKWAAERAAISNVGVPSGSGGR